MQRNLRTKHRYSRMLSLSVLVISAILLAACGPLGDDNETTPTAETIAQPTESTALTEESAPTGEATLDTGDSTPGTAAGTPSPFTPGEDRATPAQPEETFTVIVGTPVPSTDGEGTAATPGSATPVAVTEPADSGADSGVVFSGSDGTSGATPPGNEPAATEPSDSTPALSDEGTLSLIHI